MNGNESSSTWIFQADPRAWDLDAFLAYVAAGRMEPEVRWLVTLHAASIAPGDAVYLWRAGRAAAIVATAEVIGGVAMLGDDKPQYRHAPAVKQFDRDRERATFRIQAIFERPVTKVRVQFHHGLESLSILRSAQGTNFAVTASEESELRLLCGAGR